MNIYLYVRNDPLNAADPSGAWTFQIGGEVKAGARGQPAASGAGEAGLVVGTRADGDGFDLRGFTSETWGLITGRSADLQVTFCPTCNIEDIDGVDAAVANIDIPVEGGDVGIGGQVRLTDSGLQGELQLSAGVGTSQEIGSVTATQTHDIMTPLLDAGAEALAVARIAVDRVERRVEELLD